MKQTETYRREESNVQSLTVARKEAGMKRFRTMSGPELVGATLELDDPRPLHQFLKRDLIEEKNFYQILEAKRQIELRHQGRSEEKVNRAYEITVERFVSLPKPGSGGIDCRNQYRALLKAYRDRLRKRDPRSEIERESLFGRLFVGLVHYHFNLAIFEAHRLNDPTTTRYEWKKFKKSMWLTRPSDTDAKTLKAWLDMEYPNGIPESEENRREVQSRVWEHFKRPVHVPLTPESHVLDNTSNLWDKIDALERRLMHCVVTEKMENFDQLPSRLKCFERKGLKTFIEHVFGHLLNGTFEATQIADHFGIPKSTFSRIAGPHWVKKIGNGKKVNIPDLWANVNTVLSTNPDFQDAVRESGIQRILDQVKLMEDVR